MRVFNTFFFKNRMMKVQIIDIFLFNCHATVRFPVLNIHLHTRTCLLQLGDDKHKGINFIYLKTHKIF